MAAVRRPSDQTKKKTTYPVDEILQRMGQFDGHRLVVRLLILEIVDVAQTVVHRFQPELFAWVHFDTKHFVA